MSRTNMLTFALHSIRCVVAALLCIVWFLSPTLAQDDLPSAIQQRLVDLAKPGGNTIARDAVVAVEFLNAFYAARGYQPAWRNADNFADLRREILEARNDGLRLHDFHAHALGFGGLDFWPPAMTPAERDILKTSALVNLLYQLYFGKVSPERVDPHWNLQRQAPLPLENAVRTISIALETSALPALVKQARGNDPGYLKLRKALKSYRDIAEGGGWSNVAAGPALKPGMTDSRVPAIRQRLAATGDLQGGTPANPEAYDAVLVEAVKVFQKRHGIDIDGIVGPAMTRAMNVPATQRVDQIRVNLERARWGA
ncbi:MAG: peptidoglycan-binding protein, partial [Pseudomonadota bacterium]